jgi:menaquinone-dependent protoporphyrinogen oxidase
MKVLVTAASRHGATAEIAWRIGEVLWLAGIDADVRRPDEVGSVAPYDGVVLGSSVYAGRWLAPARKLVERDQVVLSSRLVWLFSSGPVGEPAMPAGEPVDGAAIRERIHAIEHRVFAGKLERRQLGLAERAMVAVAHGAEGDYRSWDAVSDWASGIARTLEAQLATDGVR